MATVQNHQITSNNETFTQSVYNGFKIIIRNSDGYINASNVVKQINDRENTAKQIKTLFKSVQYQDFENRLRNILQGKILPGKNLKTLFFYQILFEQYLFKTSGRNSGQWQFA